MPVEDYGRVLAMYVRRFQALPDHLRAQAVADAQVVKLWRSPMTMATQALV